MTVVVEPTTPERQWLDRVCSAKAKGYYFSPAYKRGTWDGRIRWYREPRGVPPHFTSGLLEYVVRRATRDKLPVTLEDKRGAGPVPDLRRKLVGLTLRPYQEAAVDAVLDRTLPDNPGGSLWWPRGILRLGTGCHRAGQLVVMYDGSLRAIEDVRVGDRMMGPDSRPRTVLDLHRGTAPLWTVTPHRAGDPFSVTGDHRLTLVETPRDERRPGGKVFEATPDEIQNWQKTKRHISKLFRVGVEFPAQDGAALLPIDPYFLGVLIGDGHLKRSGVSVCKPDLEIRTLLEQEAPRWGFRIRTYMRSPNNPSYHLPGDRRLRDALDNLGLLKLSKDKFIPKPYLVASRTDRLRLLAGLLDTDGHYDHGFEIATASFQLGDDIAFLARSLGFACARKVKHVRLKGWTVSRPYARLHINGDLDQIPTRIPRKQAAPRRQKKDHLRSGFTLTPSPVVEPYYGVQVDGDGRYLLGDFTVTHNSGKTTCIAQLAGVLAPARVLILVHRLELLDQLAVDLERWLGERVGKIGGGLLDPQRVTVATVQTLAQSQEALEAVQDVRAIIADETQRIAAAQHQLVFSKLKHAYVRVGVSATPHDESNPAQIMGVMALTGDIRYVRDAAELVAEGVVAPVTVTYQPMDLPTHVSVGPRTYTAAHLPWRPVNDPVRSKTDPLTGEVNKVVLEPGAYEALIVQNSHRNAAIARWVAERPDLTTLVMVTRVEHGKILAALMDCPFISGEEPMEERRAALLLLKRKKINVLVASTILDEGVNCLDPLTEVLTPHGWKRRDDVAQSDLVMTLNMATNRGEWNVVKRVVSRNLRPDERCVRLKTQHMDALVTEDHDLIVADVEYRGGEKITGPWEKLRAGDAADRCGGRVDLPLSVYGPQENVVDLTPDQIRFLAWLHTDGGVEGSDSTYAVIRQAIHSPFCAEIRALLDRLGFRSREDHRTYRNGLSAKSITMATFNIGRRQCASLIDHHWDRYRLAGSLRDMNREQFMVFWAEAMKADGSTGVKWQKTGPKSGYLASCRERFIDDLQALAARHGFASLKASPVNADDVQYYTLRVRDTDRLQTIFSATRNNAGRRFDWSEEHPEWVWCVTTENGTVLTRRNGKVLVLGNCPQIRRMVLAGGGRSEIRQLQRIGRGMRKETATDTLEVLDFLDTTHKNLIQHSKARVKAVSAAGYAIRVVEDEKKAVSA